MTHVRLKRTVLKLALVFKYGVSEIKNRAHDVGATIEQKRESSGQQKKTKNFISRKTKKLYECGPQICTPPDFGRETLIKPRY